MAPRRAAVRASTLASHTAPRSSSRPRAAPTAAVDAASGVTEADIAAFRRDGYVVLRGMFSAGEVDELRREVEWLEDRCPAVRGGDVDAAGRPVPGSTGGFHHYHFTDPDSGDDPRTYNSTRLVVNRVNSPLGFAPRALEAYGSPALLRAADALCGTNFVPFGVSYVLKVPRDGAGFGFHQDAGLLAQLDRPWQADRGLNMGLYLHHSTPQNGCLYVVPGSHTAKHDLRRYARGAVPPGAVPVRAAPGDVVVHARNVVHGSAPNTSGDARATLYFGFLPHHAVRALHGEADIRQRQRRMLYAVAARRRRRGEAEAPYDFHALAGEPASSAEVLDPLLYPDLQI